MYFQELRKKFEKSNDDVDSALSKYMSKKAKDPTLHEVRKKKCTPKIRILTF